MVSYSIPPPPYPKAPNSLGKNLIPCQLPFQMMPRVFNGVTVWMLYRPVYNLISMGFKPLFRLFASVLGVIILLKDNVIFGFVVQLDACLKFIIQDLHIKVPIYLPINLACISNPLPCHTSPHHQGSTSKLLCPLHPNGKMMSSILLIDVLYCPEIDLTLISISKLTDARFDSHFMSHCKIFDGRDKVIGDVLWRNGLY